MLVGRGVRMALRATRNWGAGARCGLGLGDPRVWFAMG